MTAFVPPRPHGGQIRLGRTPRFGFGGAEPRQGSESAGVIRALRALQYQGLRLGMGGGPPPPQGHQHPKPELHLPRDPWSWGKTYVGGGRGDLDPFRQQSSIPLGAENMGLGSGTGKSRMEAPPSCRFSSAEHPREPSACFPRQRPARRFSFVMK